MDNLKKEDRTEGEYIDLKVYLGILKRWKVLIAAITLLTVFTSGVLSFLVLPPVYESKAVIMVSEYQDPKTGSNGEGQQDNLQSVVDSMSRLPQLTIKTYVGQITNEALLRQVIKELKLDKTIYTPEALRKMVDVSDLPETNLIEIKVKNEDSVLAAN